MLDNSTRYPRWYTSNAFPNIPKGYARQPVDRGQLVGVRTLSVYWERRLTYTSEGSGLSYRAWLTVGVPIATLTSLREDAKLRSSNYEKSATQLAELLRSRSASRTGWSGEQAVRFLEDAHGLMRLRDDLMIASPAGDNQLAVVLSRLKSGLRHEVNRRTGGAGSAVNLETRLTLFGVPLAGVAYEISGLQNGKLGTRKGNLTVGGELSLNLTGVRYLDRTTFVLSLMSPDLAALRIELAPRLTNVPVEVEVVAHNAQELGPLKTSIEEQVLAAHPLLVRCGTSHSRCFRLVVKIETLTSEPRMAKRVYQSRGSVSVALDTLPLVYLKPIERKLVGVGSSIKQSQRHFNVVLLDEIQKVTATLLGSL